MSKHFSHMAFTKKKVSVFCLLVILAALLPLIFSNVFAIHVMIMIMIYSIAGIGWNFIGGYGGQISTGHAFFFTIGVFTPAVLFKHYGTIPWISLIIGMLLAVFVAWLIGKPLLKMNGPQFSIATMAITEALRVLLANNKWFGGAAGIDFLNKKVNPFLYMQFPNKILYFYIIYAFLLIIILLAIYMDKSRFCYYLRAIRGNETAAASIGINCAKYKSLAFMLSAAICSLAGSLYAQYLLYVDPYMCSTMSVSLMICLVAVMGGCGTVFGPIIGAIILQIISQYTRVLAGGTGSGIDLMIYGALVVVFVLFMPQGLGPVMEKGIRKLISRSSKKMVKEGA